MITETNPPSRARVVLAPLFLLRVPCLPVSAVAALRMPEHEARLRRLEALDAELAVEGAPITDALFQLVPQISQSDDEPRRRVASLLALKRAVYQGSPPKDARVLDDVEALLPDALRSRLAGWLALAHERQRLTVALAGGFDRELARARDGLKDCLRHTELR